MKRGAESDKKLATVCGLYCEACTWFIASTEEPERLKRLAAQAGYSEEESMCFGCRSRKRLAYCDNCRMFACALGRGVDFCSECEEYPCDDLKNFQAARPHRIELWDNLDRIKAVGYKKWLKEIREHYTCPQCGTVNSTYDSKCRNCGNDPSCNYVAKHRKTIDQFLKK